MHNLSEQTNYGQVVQIGCFRFVVKQAVCSDSCTTKHLVRDTLRPDETADNLPYEKVGNNEPVCIADEVPFEIPESWEWLKHNELFEISGGSQPPKSKFINEPKENYVRLFQIRDYGNNPLPVYIPISTASKTTVKGDILLARYGASLGKVFWAEDGAYNVAMAKVIPLYHCIDEIIDKEYLFYYYHTDLYRSTVFGNSRSAQAGFNKGDLESMWFPLPPLMEQKRIVAKIKEMLPLVEQYEVAYSEVNSFNNSFPELLKKSILQEAVQGKLVPQDPNDEPASVLLERIRAEKQALIKAGKIKKDKNESVIFRRDNSHYEKLNGIERCIDDELPFEIPKNWQWERWGNISQSIQYGYNAPAKSDGKIKMVRISDIQNNTVKWDSVPFCDIAEDDIETYLLKSNDILFARTGGTVGKSYLVTEILEDAIYAGYLIRTRYSDELIPQYLKYFMESELYWSQLRSGTIATAQPNCNGQTLSKMLLPIPPKAEQERIIQMIDTLYSKI